MHIMLLYHLPSELEVLIGLRPQGLKQLIQESTATNHVKYRTSHVEHHMSHVTHHTPHVIHHTSHETCTAVLESLRSVSRRVVTQRDNNLRIKKGKCMKNKTTGLQPAKRKFGRIIVWRQSTIDSNQIEHHKNAASNDLRCHTKTKKGVKQLMRVAIPTTRAVLRDSEAKTARLKYWEG
jgi:hypothetical protein